MMNQPKDNPNQPDFPDFNSLSDVLKFRTLSSLIPSEFPSSVEEAIDSLDEAKIALICCCFSSMLSEGITWLEIFQTIASRMPSISVKEQEAIATLERVGKSLTLTRDDFVQS